MNNLKNSPLLYPQEHLTCPHYVSDRRCYFRYVLLNVTSLPLSLLPECNHLLFVQKGDVIIKHNNAKTIIARQNRISFVPINSEVTLYPADQQSQLLICSFDVPLNLCDKLIFQKLSLSENAVIPLPETPIKEPMAKFVDSMIHYLQDKINCEHLHEIKQKEMFFLFKWYYTKKELSVLFHDLASDSLKFKIFVLTNYKKTRLNVGELSKMAGMSRTRFDVKFKSEFGKPPLQWMQAQLANKILFMANEPEVTINEIMDTFGFTSQLGFIRFCKHQFNCTPKELLSRNRNA